MRWLLASLAALAFRVGLRTLGDGGSCDSWGVRFYLPAAVVVFVLVGWGWALVRPAPGARDGAP